MRFGGKAALLRSLAGELPVLADAGPAILSVANELSVMRRCRTFFESIFTDTACGFGGGVAKSRGRDRRQGERGYGVGGFRVSCVRSKAAIVASAIIGFAASFPERVSADTCSTEYHARLSGLAEQRGEQLLSVVPDLRSGDPALPGRWLFNFDPGQEKRGRVRTVAVVRQVCTQYEGRGRRARCVATENRTVGTNEIAFATARDKADVAAVRALQDFVARRGAVPEVGENGRLGWHAQRLSQDLRAYITQPSHPAICSGGREVSEFYGSQLAPLEKRQQDVRTLVGTARLRARERVAAFTAISAPAPEAVSSASQVSTSVLVSPAVAAAGHSAGGAAAGETARDFLRSTLAVVLTPEQNEDIAGEETVFAALRRAKSFLLDKQDEKVFGENPDLVPAAVGGQALGQVLLAIEVLAYAEYFDARYDLIRQSILAMPGDIRKAHEATCGCDD